MIYEAPIANILKGLSNTAVTSIEETPGVDLPPIWD